MKNVAMKVEGSKLLLEIDLSQDFGPSASGKTRTIASTGGFAVVKDGISLNLNVCAKK